MLPHRRPYNEAKVLVSQKYLLYLCNDYRGNQSMNCLILNIGYGKKISYIWILHLTLRVF